MELNEQLAEFVGAFIGDGCLSKWSRKDRPSDVKVISFTGSWKNDSQYYQEIINPFIKEIFGKGGRIYHRKDDNSIRYTLYNKDIILFLIELGFDFGPKSRTVTIPDKIVYDKELSIACIRGIFNTDGCIYRRYSKKYKNHPKAYLNYKVIQFRLNSENLLHQIKNILYNFGIK
ncbi:hypothetical protein K8R33_03235, partial [archaeon]|nr:hypothetical protein [archaeon]